MLTILGQPCALAQLQRSLRAQRLASTWIFAGPPGTGKFTLATQLAKTKLCDNPQHQQNNNQIPLLPDDFAITLPCNTCESCRAIENNAHPDLHIITKELIRQHDASGTSKGTTLSIAVIRGEITGDPSESKESKIGKRSFRGHGKFFIIDEADLMQTQAQNALLKTLEEPPPDTYLILITASPAELLSTIRSRSQIVLFNELPTDIITQRLMSCPTPLHPDEAALLSRLARSSLGRALRWADDIRLIDEKNAKAAERKAKAATEEEGEEGGVNKFTPGGILAWTHNLTGTLDQLVLAQANASDVATLIAQYAAEYSALALLRDRFTSADRAKRDGIALLLAIAAEWFADRLRQSLNTPHSTPLPSTTAALDPTLIQKLITITRTAEAQIDLNANDKILLAATTTQWEQLLKHT